MFEVRVEAEFAAAHFLSDYHGKCEHLHGHNYRVFAHVWGADLDRGGMLCDFSVLKRALREVCAALDHTNLNDLACFAGNPSAERIAFYIYTELSRLLPRTAVAAVDVFETPSNRARFIPDEIARSSLSTEREND